MLDAVKNTVRRIVFLFSLASLFGCSLASTPTIVPPAIVTQPTTISQPVATGAPQTFKDPFAYCAAVGDADTVDTRYTGEKIPGIVVTNLRQVLRTPTDAPNDIFLRATFWRCMNGKVYACFVGANLPCSSKANTEKIATQAEKDFCRVNPRADIPAAVTGRDTIYTWKCSNGVPEIVKQVFQTDPRGFISEIWYELKPS